MVVLKCPKCGRLCREGVVPFPRCARCHEQLLKCRYCADYDARMLDCVSPFRTDEPRIRDPDLYLACPYHRTTLAPTQKALRRRVWMAAIAIGLLAGAGAIFAVWPRPAPPHGPNLHARIAPPTEESFLREPMVLEFQIWNPGPGRISEIILALDRSYRKHVELTYVEPEPLEERRTLKWDRMWFSGLEEGEVLEVRLHVTPIKQGTWQLLAEVLSPDISRRETVAATFEISP
jgi:hypothetical protein